MPRKHARPILVKLLENFQGLFSAYLEVITCAENEHIRKRIIALAFQLHPDQVLRKSKEPLHWASCGHSLQSTHTQRDLNQSIHKQPSNTFGSKSHCMMTISIHSILAAFNHGKVHQLQPKICTPGKHST